MAITNDCMVKLKLDRACCFRGQQFLIFFVQLSKTKTAVCLDFCVCVFVT